MKLVSGLRNEDGVIVPWVPQQAMGAGVFRFLATREHLYAPIRGNANLQDGTELEDLM